jgi:hypothetical protein
VARSRSTRRAPDSCFGSDERRELTDDFLVRRLNAALQMLVCTVGKGVLLYDARCIDDLHAMLVERGDWVELGSADERKPAKEGTVEAWGRAPGNPVGGWYGPKKGMRGRFGMYLPALLEHLGLADLEHQPCNNRMHALT